MIPDYTEFANTWQAAWNAHDLDQILSHYTDDIVFRSRKAQALVGTGEVRGKAQLRAYWQAALTAQPDLRFRVQSVLGGHQMLVIVYRNHKDVLAAETLYFAPDGRVERASACHEVPDAAQSYRIRVDLWIKPGQRAAFDAYERKAVAAMARYGGQLHEVRQPETGPDEQHILSFPSKQDLEAYLNGPEAQKARAERDLCIDRTDVTELTA